MRSLLSSQLLSNRLLCLPWRLVHHHAGLDLVMQGICLQNMATDLGLLLGEGKASFLVPIQDTLLNEVLCQVFGDLQLFLLGGEPGLE